MTTEEKYMLIVDAWRFWRTHSDVREDDEWWDKLIRDADDLWIRHNRSDASRKLITAVMMIIKGEYDQKKTDIDGLA